MFFFFFFFLDGCITYTVATTTVIATPTTFLSPVDVLRYVAVQYTPPLTLRYNIDANNTTSR